MNNEDVEKATRQAKASLAIEGMHITKEQDDLVRARLTGEITEEEFQKKVRALILDE